MHTLLVGRSHSGMSDIVKEISQGIPDLWGFETEAGKQDETGLCKIYIHNVRTLYIHEISNCIGTCCRKHTEVFPEGFRKITKELYDIPDGRFVVINQLGRIENGAPSFQNAVRSLFDRCTVFAAVRDLEDDFLLSLQNRNDVRIFYMDDLDPQFLCETVLQEAAFAHLKKNK